MIAQRTKRKKLAESGKTISELRNVPETISQIHPETGHRKMTE